MTGEKPDELIRTPMQWSAGPNAGFSSATPWEPVSQDYQKVNVSIQDVDPASVLSHYRRLIHLRNAHPALRTGSLRALDGTCSTTYAYLRSLPEDAQAENLLVVLNFSAKKQRHCAFSLPSRTLTPGSYDVIDLLTGQPAAHLSVGEDGGIAGYVPLETLSPRQAAILKLAPLGG